MIAVDFLDEDTRTGTIVVAGKAHDLHVVDESYYICTHGKTTIVAIMTKDFYESLTK